MAIVKLIPSSSSSSGDGSGQQQQQRRQEGQQQQQQQQGQQQQQQQQRGMELLCFFPGDAVSVRAARWIPPAACGDAVDLLHRHVFVTVGHEGALRIWDDRWGALLRLLRFLRTHTRPALPRLLP